MTKLYPCYLVIDATEANCVGTFIKNVPAMEAFLTEKAETGEFDELGKMFIKTPEEMLQHLVCGGAKRNLMTEDNRVIKEYRPKDGQEPSAFLDRNKVTVPDAQSSFSILYNMAAIEADTDISENEVKEIKAGGYTHMWVMTRADAHKGYAPMSPYRFAANLAGGNTDFDVVSESLRSSATKAVATMNHSGTIFFEDPTESPAYIFCTAIMNHPDSDVIVGAGDRAKVLREQAQQIRDYYCEWVTVAG